MNDLQYLTLLAHLSLGFCTLASTGRLRIVLAVTFGLLAAAELLLAVWIIHRAPSPSILHLRL